MLIQFLSVTCGSRLNPAWGKECVNVKFSMSVVFHVISFPLSLWEEASAVAYSDSPISKMAKFKFLARKPGNHVSDKEILEQHVVKSVFWTKMKIA